MVKNNLFSLGLLLAFSISTNSFAKVISFSFSLDTKFGSTPIEVHFDPKDVELAKRVEEIAKNDLIKVVDYFQYAPNETVHFNINSNMRLSNGNARTFPINVINLYNFPASNKDHLTIMEDWWRGLIVHEFTHVVHLDHTRDYTEVGKKIFGTVAKLPAQIVPRWFTEGIAVYSESKFLKAGRIQSDLLNKELFNYYNSNNSCKDLDCIDEPGQFPNGSLSYWIGGQFINYVENLKPGSIKCLVEVNAGKIPFFLNRVFEECTTKSVYELYDNFRDQFISQFKFEANNEKINPFYGETNFQKGFVLKGNQLFKIERKKNNEMLVATDLEANVSMGEFFSHPIESLSNIVKLDDETEAILVSFNDDPTFKTSNRVWKLINTETLTEEASLNFETDPSYAFAQDKIIYGAFAYKDNHWNFKQVQFALGKPYTVSEANLPTNFNLNFVRLLNKKYVLKVTDVNTQKTSIIIADLNLTHTKVVFESDKFFDVFGVGENYFVVKQGDSFTQYFIDGDTVQSQTLDSKQFVGMTTFEETKETRVALNRKFEWGKASGLLVSGNKSPVTLSDWTFEKTETKQIKTESYPKLNHFKPHYWFLSAGSSATVSSMGAMTTFADPEEIHNFSVSGLYFPDISRAGGTFNYSYDDSPRGFDLYLNQDYNKTDSSSTVVNENRKIDVNLKYTFEKKRLTFIPAAIFGIDSNNDFISKRNTKYIGGRVTAQYIANSNSDTLQSVTVVSRFAIDTPSGNDSYGNFQNKIDVWSRLNDNLLLQTRFASGKLFKSDFRRGVLFGGGLGSLQTSRFFEYYGITYGNAYGNEIINSRIKLDYELYDFYRGRELLPFLLREVHLLLGYENLKADVIYQNKKYFSNETVHSIFSGVKLKTMLFYLVPTDIDLVVSGTRLPDASSNSTVSVAINAGLF